MAIIKKMHIIKRHRLNIIVVNTLMRICKLTKARAETERNSIHRRRRVLSLMSRIINHRVGRGLNLAIIQSLINIHKQNRNSVELKPQVAYIHLHLRNFCQLL